MGPDKRSLWIWRTQGGRIHPSEFSCPRSKRLPSGSAGPEQRTTTTTKTRAKGRVSLRRGLLPAPPPPRPLGGACSAEAAAPRLLDVPRLGHELRVRRRVGAQEALRVLHLGRREASLPAIWPGAGGRRPRRQQRPARLEGLCARGGVRECFGPPLFLHVRWPAGPFKGSTEPPMSRP